MTPTQPASLLVPTELPMPPMNDAEIAGWQHLVGEHFNSGTVMRLRPSQVERLLVEIQRLRKPASVGVRRREAKRG